MRRPQEVADQLGDAWGFSIPEADRRGAAHAGWYRTERWLACFSIPAADRRDAAAFSPRTATCGCGRSFSIPEADRRDAAAAEASRRLWSARRGFSIPEADRRDAATKALTSSVVGSSRFSIPEADRRDAAPSSPPMLSALFSPSFSIPEADRRDAASCTCAACNTSCAVSVSLRRIEGMRRNPSEAAL